MLLLTLLWFFLQVAMLYIRIWMLLIYLLHIVTSFNTQDIHVYNLWKDQGGLVSFWVHSCYLIFGNSSVRGAMCTYCCLLQDQYPVALVHWITQASSKFSYGLWFMLHTFFHQFGWLHRIISHIKLLIHDLCSIILSIMVPMFQWTSRFCSWHTIYHCKRKKNTSTKENSKEQKRKKKETKRRKKNDEIRKK